VIGQSYHEGERLLELAVLGLLKESPMSGYELQKQLTAKLGAFWRVSFGSLYPCLKRLSAQGALEVLDSPSMSRKKHVYRLTETGELLFQELLESADVHDLEQDRFPLRLAFFRYLQPETRIDQLERRRGYLQQRLRDLRASLRAARDRMDAYTLSLMDHGLEEREREIAWLDGLIAAERGASAAAGEPDAGGRYLEPGQAAPTSSGTRPAPARRRVSRSSSSRRVRAGTEQPAAEQPGSGGSRRARRAARPISARGGRPEATTARPPEAAGPDQSEPAPQAPDTSDHDLPTSAGAIAQTRRVSG
jgi:DNA-binding PadR family transcriptional regulator